MRKASSGAVLGNPGDPRFLALLEQGATEAEFVGLAEEAARRSIRSPWPWILQTLQGRRADASAIRLTPQDASGKDAAAPAAWDSTAAGIKAKGAELGAPWSEDGWVKGQHYAFPAYTAMVRKLAAEGDNRRAA